MILERIKPSTYREYGGWEYVGEMGEYILAMHIDCEGRYHTEIHALSKKVWKIKE